MRFVVLGLVAVVGLTSLQGDADAGERQFLFLRWQDGRSAQAQHQEYAQPQDSQQQQQQPGYTYEQAPSQSNPFGQIMEMERRKNAWLRRTFFGQ